MSFALQPASLADASRLAQMTGRLIERELARRWTAPRICNALRDPETAGVVAQADGAMLGFALMRYAFSHREAHLLLLAVEPVARLRGVGRALVAWLEKTARLGGIERVVLEVRTDDQGAQRFYERLGYRGDARLPRYYEGRLDAVRMVRALRSNGGSPAH